MSGPATQAGRAHLDWSGDLTGLTPEEIEEAVRMAVGAIEAEARAEALKPYAELASGLFDGRLYAEDPVYRALVKRLWGGVGKAYGTIVNDPPTVADATQGMRRGE